MAEREWEPVQVRQGPRRGLAVRSEIVRVRVTPSTKEEIVRWAQLEERTETEMIRLLVGEALAYRARMTR